MTDRRSALLCYLCASLSYISKGHGHTQRCLAVHLLVVLLQINYVTINERRSSWCCNGEFFSMDVYRRKHLCRCGLCRQVVSQWQCKSGVAILVLVFLDPKWLMKNIMFGVLLEVLFLWKEMVLQCYYLKIVHLNCRYVTWVAGTCSSTIIYLSFWVQ